MGIYLKVHNTIYQIPDDVKYVEVTAPGSVAYAPSYVVGTSGSFNSPLVVRFWNAAKKITTVSGNAVKLKEWIELV